MEDSAYEKQVEAAVLRSMEGGIGFCLRCVGDAVLHHKIVRSYGDTSEAVDVKIVEELLVGQ